MKSKLHDITSLVMVILAFATAAYLYPSLPDPVPTHWNASGDVDGWTAKPWGVWILPIITMAMFVMFKILPAISPKGFRMEQFTHIVSVFQTTLVGFMLGVTIIALLAASGAQIDPGRFIFLGIGLLLMVLGNYMGKVRKNFFIGIRTPWTLASDEVWSRTHRLGGKLLVAAGLWMAIAGILRVQNPVWVIGPVLSAALISVVYSFVIYRKVEGFDGDTEQ